MEFYYDLIPRNQIKSKFWRVVALILIIAFSVSQIIIYALENKYFLSALWLVWGGVFFYQIFIGKSFEALFGKKYIHITDKFIILKPKIFGKATTIHWNNLESIKMKPTYLVVKSKLGDEIKIDFKQIDYIAVQDLKSIVKTLVEKWKVELETN
jgi:hypothetical protein